MARSESGFDWNEEHMTDAELEGGSISSRTTVVSVSKSILSVLPTFNTSPSPEPSVVSHRFTTSLSLTYVKSRVWIPSP